MADPRFFVRGGPLSLGALAEIAQAKLGGDADPAMSIEDVAPLSRAGRHELSFLDNKRYLPALAASKAGACILAQKAKDAAPRGMALLLTEQPYLGFARAAAAFYPPAAPAAFRHPTAVVHPSAKIGADCHVDAHVVVGARAEIGDRVRLGPQVTIGPGVAIGPDTVVAANASLHFCLIGARCQIHAGARIGERGFGFVPGPEGFIDVPQLGRVLIEDGVEIGANTTVDRGAGPDTVIGAGTRIDNLVQIAHNVVIGRNCIVVSQVGISGSVRVEDNVVLGGQVGIAGHLTIGRGAQAAGQSGITRDVAAGERVCGMPAVPARQFFRQHAVLAKLARRGDVGGEDEGGD